MTDGETNASLREREGDTVEDLTDERAAELLQIRRDAGPAKKRGAKKAAKKKAPAKKKAAAKKASGAAKKASGAAKKSGTAKKAAGVKKAAAKKADRTGRRGLTRPRRLGARCSSARRPVGQGSSASAVARASNAATWRSIGTLGQVELEADLVGAGRRRVVDLGDRPGGEGVDRLVVGRAPAATSPARRPAPTPAGVAVPADLGGTRVPVPHAGDEPRRAEPPARPPAGPRPRSAPGCRRRAPASVRPSTVGMT